MIIRFKFHDQIQGFSLKFELPTYCRIMKYYTVIILDFFPVFFRLRSKAYAKKPKCPHFEVLTFTLYTKLYEKGSPLGFVWHS